MRLFESEPITEYTPPKASSSVAGSSPADTQGILQGRSSVTPSTQEQNIEPSSSLGEKTLSEEDDEAEVRGFIPVLQNRNFLTLWGGQIFSQLADKVYLVLMIAIIADRFQSADQTISGWVSAIMMAFTIPAVLFGSLAGVFVDRWHKKEVLVFTNLLRGILVLAVPFMLWLSKGQELAGLPVGFYILLFVTFLVSTLTQFFAPAEQAAISMIVDRKHLLSANSLYTTTMMGSLIIGFAVGEPLLALADTVAELLGIQWHIGKEAVVGGSYAIAGLLLVLMKTGERDVVSTEEAPHVLEDLKDGIRYLNEHHRVRSAMIELGILFSVFAAMTVIAVRMAEVIPEIKASQFGFLLAAGGVGMGCGAAILGHFGQRFSNSRLSLYGSTGVTASLLGLSFFHNHLAIALLLTASMGAFGAMVAIPLQTTIQSETPEEMRGKVFGLQNNAINIALTLPLALTGVAETIFGLHLVFFFLGITILAGRLLTWYICPTGSNSSTTT